MKSMNRILALLLIAAFLIVGMVVPIAAEGTATQAHAADMSGQTVTLDGKADEAAWTNATNVGIAANTVARFANDGEYLYFYMEAPYTYQDQNLWKIYLCVNFDQTLSPNGKSDKNTNGVYLEARIGADGGKADEWVGEGSSSYVDGISLGYTAGNVKAVTDAENNKWSLEMKLPLPESVTQKASLGAHEILVGITARYDTNKDNANKQDLTVTSEFNWNNGKVAVTLNQIRSATATTLLTTQLPVTVDGKCDEALWSTAPSIGNDDGTISAKYANDGEYLYVFATAPYANLDYICLAFSFAKNGDTFLNKSQGKDKTLFLQAREYTNGNKNNEGSNLLWEAATSKTQQVGDNWNWELKLPLPASVKAAIATGNYEIGVGMLVNITGTGNQQVGFNWQNTTKTYTLKQAERLYTETVGCQTSAVAADGTYSVRFSGVMGDYTQFTSVGFAIDWVNAEGGKKSATATCTTVYESLLANEVTVSATEKGGQYFFCFTINGLQKGEEYKFDVTSFGVLEGKTEQVYGTTQSFTITVADTVAE